MKTPLAFPALFVLLAWAIFSIACGPEIDDPPSEPEAKTCAILVGINKFDPVTNQYQIDTIEVPYRCDQVIVSGQQSLNVLLKSGYTIIDSCSCADSLYLVENTGVDPIGIIDNPPPGTKDSSLALNIIPLDTFDVKSRSKVEVDNYTNPEPEGVRTVKIGVVDTGVEPAAPNLLDFLWNNPGPENACPGYQFALHGLDLSNEGDPTPKDLNGHGTHVSGIAAGLSPNLIFNSGTEQIRLELITAKVTENSRDAMDLFTATCGIHYVLDQGAEVINLSWGYLDTMIIDNNGDTIRYVPWVMLDALKEARDSGVVIVAALGNDGLKLGEYTKFWPASFSENWDNVIAVGASADTDGMKRVRFSNWYDKSTLLAPGERISSVVPFVTRRWNSSNNSPIPLHFPDGWADGSGTSMSAPFVTRAVALMLGKRVPTNVAEIKTRILGGTPGFDPQSLINNW